MGVEPNVDAKKTTFAAKISGKRSREYTNLEPKSKVDWVVLQAHCSGKKQQVSTVFLQIQVSERSKRSLINENSLLFARK